MTSIEKETLWDNISSRTFDDASDTFVRKPILSRLYYRGLLPAISQQSVFFRNKKYTLGVIAGTLIVTGGLSAFAQSALPGDLLYPMKTLVTEQLQVALLSTPKEKATAEATLATRRLEETEKLALTGKLNLRLVQETNKAFDSHVRNFEQQLTKLEEQKDFDTIAKVGVFFQTRIAVHAAILKDIEINTSILASKAVATSTEYVAPSQIVSHIEKNVLVSIIPTIIVTKKALTILASSTPLEDETFKNQKQKHTVVLDVDSNEARDYLLKLHEEVGIPAPILQAVVAPVVPVFVP